MTHLVNALGKAEPGMKGQLMVMSTILGGRFNTYMLSCQVSRS